MSPLRAMCGRYLFGHSSHVKPAMYHGRDSLLVNGDTSVGSISLDNEMPGIVVAAAAHGGGISSDVTFSTEILTAISNPVYLARARGV